MVTQILTASFIMQLGAAALAFAMIRTTRVPWAWLFIAAALVLMAGRRAISLYSVLAGQISGDVRAELVALLISLSMVIGVALLRPLFTRLKAQTNELARKEHELRAIIEAAPDGVALVGKSAVRYVNPALVTLLGEGNVGLLLDRPLRELVHEDDSAGFLAALSGESSKEAISCAPREVRFRCGRDRYVPLEVAFGPELLAHGEPVKLLQLRDLSERKRLEAALLESKKLEAIGRLSGGIAHDFNNALTVIMASTDLARVELPPDHPASRELDEVQHAATRAARLTAQLLAFARSQPVSPTEFDLDQLIATMSGMLQRSLRENIRIHVEPCVPPVVVHADRGQIEQVILNLAINARDAMPDGGQLTIRTRRGPALGQTTTCSGVFEVSDQGLGLDAYAKEHIFEPFFTNKALGSGSGLGLSSSYGIVSRAGGRIEVESVPGCGTTFRVTLPGADMPSPRVTSSVVVPAHKPGPGGRILLVEDQAPLRRVAARGLRGEGYEVFEAPEGHSALTLLAALDVVPDLLVTDIVMPGMDGAELARRVLTDYPALQILFMTGYGHHTLTGIPAYAASQILHKPFTVEALCARVRQMLASERMRVAAGS